MSNEIASRAGVDGSRRGRILRRLPERGGFCSGRFVGRSRGGAGRCVRFGRPRGRGPYLVTVMACNDCHTPFKMGKTGPEPDMSRMLSGHPEGMKVPPPPKLEGGWMMAGSATNTAWAGPWGVSYTSNLTPDQNTGIGIWTEDMFIKAMRTGKHMGTSRTILQAIFAYLKSIPPIHNRVPDPEPPAGTK